MTQLVVELPSDAYERLRQRADALGKSSAAVAADVLTVWVADSPAPSSPLDMQARATQVLREAGLLVAYNPSPKQEWASMAYLSSEGEADEQFVANLWHEAGLLTELGEDMKQLAAESLASLEEVRAALDASEGPLLSELIIEMRGPK